MPSDLIEPPQATAQTYARLLADRTTVVWIDGLPWGKDTPRHPLLKPLAMPHTLGNTDPLTRSAGRCSKPAP